jgi:anti-sigma factor RsiW
MDCPEARVLILDRRRGALPEDVRAQVDRHLAGCEACRQEDAADRVLSTLLEERLPRPTAPASLRRSLEARFATPAESTTPVRTETRARSSRRVGALAAFAAAALGGVLFLFSPLSPLSVSRAPDRMVAEAVSDHLRVLYSEHPLEVASGGVHQVKPWFEGRVDFAPVVGFGGDEDFPLEGGAVAYFVDRKAAMYAFKRRLHLITLFVYPAAGLPWPVGGNVAVGHARATLETSRGFHVLLWRDADLGYALVSDLDEHELETLGAKIAGP